MDTCTYVIRMYYYAATKIATVTRLVNSTVFIRIHELQKDILESSILGAPIRGFTTLVSRNM